MPFQNELILETSDFKLARTLLSSKIDGCNIAVYQTRAAEIEPVAKIIIEILSNAAIAALGAWLNSYFASKETSGKTTINNIDISKNSGNINIIINQQIDKQESCVYKADE